MRLRWFVAVSACLLVAITLAGCGSSAKPPPCIVLSNGNEVCGNAAVAWCETQSIALMDSDTQDACRTVGNWSTRGQTVVTAGPNGNPTTTP